MCLSPPAPPQVSATPGQRRRTTFQGCYKDYNKTCMKCFEYGKCYINFKYYYHTKDSSLSYLSFKSCPTFFTEFATCGLCSKTGEVELYAELSSQQSTAARVTHQAPTNETGEKMGSENSIQKVTVIDVKAVGKKKKKLLSPNSQRHVDCRLRYTKLPLCFSIDKPCARGQVSFHIWIESLFITFIRLLSKQWLPRRS